MLVKLLKKLNLPIATGQLLYIFQDILKCFINVIQKKNKKKLLLLVKVIVMIK